MAKVKCFAVYDSKVGNYMAPFFMLARGQAIRAFTETVNDGQSMMSRHPADFTLFEIGEYDEDKGALVPYAANVSLGVAIEFKNVDKQMELGDAGLKRLDVSKIVQAVEKNAASSVS